MRIDVLTLGSFFGFAALAVHAGTVVTLAPAPEANGKASLTADAIHVETSPSAVDFKLSDVLEADFSDTPFHLESFTTIGNTGTTLPADWKGQDITPGPSPGSVTFKDGAFTLIGNGQEMNKGHVVQADEFFFAGRPWTGDGEWTARLKEVAAKNPQTIGGLMLRDTLEPGSPFSAGASNAGGASSMIFRADAGRPLGGRPGIPMDLPIWLRLTRYGPSVDVAMSADGKDWTVVGQQVSRSSVPQSWIGFFADSRKAGLQGQVTVDNVSFTPAPSGALVIPPGVILQGGTFLAGGFDRLELDPAAPDMNGSFFRNGKPLPLSRSKIAVVTLLPTLRSQLIGAGAQIGLLMKNGDFMTGDFQTIDRAGVHVTSELLGPVVYAGTDVQACLLQTLQPQAAAYVVRLKDGSVIRASGIAASKDQVSITDISGTAIEVKPDEIAQLRSGTAQSLLEFPWQVIPPGGAAIAAPAAAAPADPAAATPATVVPALPCWEGTNQEQVLVAPAGTAVQFSLTGAFGEMAMRIALVPGGAANAQATLRILADGRELGRTPPFKAGEEPRWMRITLQHPRTITLQAESDFPGTKLFLIDPVVVQAH